MRDFISVLIGAVCLLTGLPAFAEAVTIQGSTTFNSTIFIPHKAAIEAASGQVLNVVPNRSNLGLMALLEGRADLAMLSAPLESELVHLSSADQLDRLVSVPVAKTRATIAVHPDNPTKEISREALARVLRGEISNWAELGGPSLPIVVVAVREGGGVLMSVEHQLLDKQPIRPTRQVRVQVATNVVRVIEQEPGALGISQMNIVRSMSGRVRELPVLGTPVEQVLSLVSVGRPSDRLEAVIEAVRRLADAEFR
jgi:phosphate transport system substrate-binding protein